jgi:hypothetical protein
VKESPIPMSVSACLGTCGVAGLTMLTMVGVEGRGTGWGGERQRGERAQIYK